MREGELLALKPRRFDFERGTLTVAESYQRIDGQDVLTDPKTPKSKRVIAMPRFYAEEMEAFLSALDLDPDERIFPVTKYFLSHEMARVYRELRRIRSAGEVDEGLAWTVDFLAREFSAMRGEAEPSDVEREDALIFGMSRR